MSEDAKKTINMIKQGILPPLNTNPNEVPYGLERRGTDCSLYSNTRTKTSYCSRCNKYRRCKCK